MLVPEEITNCIDTAEEVFLECWDTLEILKKRETQNQKKGNILLFQETLAKALYDLEQLRGRINVEKRAIIAAKHNTESPNIEGRLATLARFEIALRDTISVGKAIGDAFAWAFYQSDPDFLFQHANHANTFHLPQGLGGLAEISAVKKVKVVAGNILLYHGITTFLNLGDFTLFNLANLRVAGIGEIKYCSSEGLAHTAIFKVHARRKDLPEEELSRISIRSDETSPKSHLRLPPRVELKLSKQMNKIAEAFEHLSMAKEKADIRTGFHFGAVQFLASHTKQGNLAVITAGDSLVLCVCDNQIKNLSSLLSDSQNQPRFDGDKMLSEVMNTFKDDVPLELRSLRIGSLLYSTEKSTPLLLHGMAPPFWWPIDIDFLKQLYFRNISIQTVLNPSNILLRFQQRGYQIESVNESRGRYTLMKRLGEKVQRLDIFPWVFWMLEQYLFTEESILALIESMEQGIGSKRSPPRCRIYINFMQNLFPEISLEKDL